MCVTEGVSPAIRTNIARTKLATPPLAHPQDVGGKIGNQNRERRNARDPSRIQARAGARLSTRRSWGSSERLIARPARNEAKLTPHGQVSDPTSTPPSPRDRGTTDAPRAHVLPLRLVALPFRCGCKRFAGRCTVFDDVRTRPTEKKPNCTFDDASFAGSSSAVQIWAPARPASTLFGAHRRHHHPIACLFSWGGSHPAGLPSTTTRPTLHSFADNCCKNRGNTPPDYPWLRLRERAHPTRSPSGAPTLCGGSDLGVRMDLQVCSRSSASPNA